ncbi:MAG: hypothetical protein H3Z51_06890 [archaeon]|nr:hypothetical protein [archaeon]
MVTLCLRKIIDDGNVPIHWVGHSADKYDIEIPIGTNLFDNQPVLISVKTRDISTLSFETVPPKRTVINKIKERTEKLHYKFWIGLVLYEFKDKKLSFVMYLIDSKSLKPEDYGNDEQIYFKNLIEKASLIIESEDTKAIQDRLAKVLGR